MTDFDYCEMIALDRNLIGKAHISGFADMVLNEIIDLREFIISENDIRTYVEFRADEDLWVHTNTDIMFRLAKEKAYNQVRRKMKKLEGS